MECVHCRSSGTLNRHGRLATKSGELRGRRFWCSPRRKARPGCGRSFSVWLASAIPRHSVRAAPLARFLAQWSRLGGDVLAAWQSARTGFSTDSAHRWARGFVLNQGAVRAQLCRARAPPPAPEGGVHADLFGHLRLALGTEAFVEAFQTRFQSPWPMQERTGLRS